MPAVRAPPIENVLQNLKADEALHRVFCAQSGGCDASDYLDLGLFARFEKPRSPGFLDPTGARCVRSKERYEKCETSE